MNPKKALMLEKLKKLFRMAKDGNSENEQEIALKMANKIMAEYGIAEAEVNLSELASLETVETSIDPDGKPVEKAVRRYPREVSFLSVGVSRFTETLVRFKQTPKGNLIFFQGEKSDVEFATWLFQVLLESIRLSQLLSGWTQKGEKEAFRTTCAAELSKRLTTLALERAELYRKAQEGGSKALLVIDTKKERLNQRFGEMYVTSSQIRGHAANDAGRAAGREINIPVNRPLEGGRKYLGN